jgi:hypothetical protein
MAHDRILMHAHDHMGRSAIVRMLRLLTGTITLTMHTGQRIHVWLGEWWSSRTVLWLHLLLHRIFCRGLVPRRTGLYVSATWTISHLSADCKGCQTQQDSTIGWELWHHRAMEDS